MNEITRFPAGQGNMLVGKCTLLDRRGVLGDTDHDTKVSPIRPSASIIAGVLHQRPLLKLELVRVPYKAVGHPSGTG